MDRLLTYLKLDTPMRHKLVLASLLLSTMIPAAVKADVSIGINLELFPHLVRVPGYPVYYAPEMDSNYFFYEGQYWVYAEDSWYASSWYNGPWEMVDSEVVPLYVLRVPVRYYRQPPMYFRGWSAYSPPRWDERWGDDWSQRHRDWDHWDRRAAPGAAPLPVYQKRYSGSQYPRVDQQRQLQNTYYQRQPYRATGQPVDQSQRMRSAPVHTPSAERPSQLNDNNRVRLNRRTDQHADQYIDQPSDHHIDQHSNQRNERRPDTQQPVAQAPRVPLPATPVFNAPPIRPRPQPSEQHTTERQQPSAPQAQEKQSHNQNRRNEQRDQPQGHREKDRD